MPTAQSLPWIHPLDAAGSIDDEYWVLLYSGAGARYSYLACGLAERIEGSDLNALKRIKPAERWFGYLGYGLKNRLEEVPNDVPNWLALPDLCMMRFRTIYTFDHEHQLVTFQSETPVADFAPTKKTTPLPRVASLRSNMTKDEYLAKAAQVIERIHAGDLYQANLTRKFIGEFEHAPNAFALFCALCEASPAPYSAYLHLGDAHIISSSPELWLKVDAAGKITARPIKGTAQREQDVARDKRARDGLQVSEKDRAENLMIVDLMRHDLARSAVPGSVRAEKLFDVTTHATIHHMSSTVCAERRTDCSTLDVIKSAFPPGSMTGAPKIKAMALCSELERDERGVYSGTIGWLDGDGSAEFSVVIRTLLLRGTQFEFQVGGGIVADSTPQAEHQELIAKASGLCLALNMPMEWLEKL